MLDREPERPVTEQSLEELPETATRLKLERLKNTQKTDQVIAEMFARARKHEVQKTQA